jgi:hypothetical protein
MCPCIAATCSESEPSNDDDDDDDDEMALNSTCLSESLSPAARKR